MSRRSLLVAAVGAATAGITSRATARQATPGAALGSQGMSASARERLAGMLSLVPAGMIDVPDPNIPLFTWVDLGTHFAAFGSPDVFAREVAIVSLTSALYIDAPLIERALDEEARDLFGFSVLEADQVLSVGAPPDRLTLFAFDSPVQEFIDAWEAAGYERVEGDAGEFWTVGEEGDLDLSSDIGRFALASLNNLAIVDNSVVVGTRTSAMLQQVLAMLEAGGESAADQADLLAMLETLADDAVNVLALHGDGLEAHGLVPENPGREGDATLSSILAESDDAVGTMPQVRHAVFGITAGMATGEEIGNEDAVFFAQLGMGSADDAAQAAIVAEWRMANMISPTSGMPFAERFLPAFDPATAVEGTVALTAFTGPEGFVPWQQMVLSLDLWPFVWLDEA